MAGLVSVGSMEDQTETNSYPADVVLNHGVKRMLQHFKAEKWYSCQTDKHLKSRYLRSTKRTENGLGWSPTGNWKEMCSIPY